MNQRGIFFDEEDFSQSAFIPSAQVVCSQMGDPLEPTLNLKTHTHKCFVKHGFRSSWSRAKSYFIQFTQCLQDFGKHSKYNKSYYWPDKIFKFPTTGHHFVLADSQEMHQPNLRKLLSQRRPHTVLRLQLVSTIKE